jgi:hypothetical protein
MRRTLALSTVDMIFILVLGIRAIVYQDLLLHGDGDLASHLALGDYMLQERAIPTHDPLTFSMQDRPFVAHSWLGSLALTLVYRVGGLPGVTVFATAVLALAYSLVAHFLRRRGLDGRVVLAGAFTAVLLGTMHWLARPHIFTVLAAVILLHLLEAERPQLWAFAALFALWANLHCGFLLGLMLIGAYLLGAAAEARITHDPAWRSTAVRLLSAFGIAVIASCANPYGPMIFVHLTKALQDDVTVALTEEYQSPNFHEPTVLVLLGAIVATIAVVGVVRPRPSLTRLFAILVTLAATLHASRNVDVFSVTGWPLVWLSAARMPLHRSGRYWLGDDFARVERAAMPGPWMTASLILALVLVANGGRIAGRQVLRSEFSRAKFPVEALEAARAANSRGRLFTHFVWGGYVALAWPGQRVFITGLKYDPDVVRSYVTVGSVFPGWQKELENWNITHILVPAESPLVVALVDAKGWCTLHTDSTATLLMRSTTPAGESSCVNRRL